MLQREFLDILVCPACKAKLELIKDAWLVCGDPECGRKYPIREDIPIMLIEEGDKYVNVPVEELWER